MHLSEEPKILPILINKKGKAIVISRKNSNFAN